MWYRGLQLKSNANRDKIDVTAKTLLIGPQGDKFTDVSFTVDLSVNGVGGLDIGNQANDQWYDLVAILKRRGGLARIDGMFVKSGDTPAFPPRYSAFDRLSSHRNNGSGDLYRFTNAADSNWFKWNENLNLPDFSVLNVTTSVTAFGDIACATACPPTCRTVRMSGHVSDANTNADIWVQFRSNDATTRDGDIVARIQAITSSGTLLAAFSTEMGVDSSQIMKYRTDKTTSDVFMHITEYLDIS